MKQAVRRYLWLILCGAVLAVCAAVLVVLRGDPDTGALPRDRDTEFADGSGIVLEDATALQRDSLYKLAKVWGYVKYRHPSVIGGQVNWDAELFRVMPRVLQAADEEAVNAVLADWLEGFPFTPATAEEARPELEMLSTAPGTQNPMDWISDRAFLGEELCGYLEDLSRTHVSDWTCGYASRGEVVVDFSHEDPRPDFDGTDAGVRLLGAFRFWNAFAWFSPNVDITRTDWDDALRGAIDDMVAARDRTGYERALARLTAQTGDGHVMLETPDLGLLRYYGRYWLPCTFLSIDGEVVVKAVPDDCTALRPGDVLLAVDGMTMADRIAELSEYFPLPEPDKFVNVLAYPLMSAAGETSRVTLRRDGAEQTVEVANRTEVYGGPARPVSGLLEDGRIGYIAPGTLKEGELQALMTDFAGTDGLVVDLRQYPAVDLRFLLPEYLNPAPTEFTILELPSLADPGRFFQIPYSSGAGTMAALGLADGTQTCPLYTGQVVVLMDETSQSQAEYTIMSVRQAPGAVVVGSPSVGADGNAVYIKLPGGCRTRFTALGVLTPEGGQTQRVGLQPDVLCTPTVAGIAAGRDELLEKAVELIEAG